MDLLKPARLRKGDLIGLLSPASTPTPREKIEKSVRYLESLGYRVRVGEHAAAVHGYLAGTDEQRAGDFNSLVADSEVKALFALRGGYGTPRILSRIDYSRLRRNPKIISGFSDITALQLAIYRRCKLVTFSGPMPAVEFWQDPDPYTEEHFWRLLTSRAKVGPLTNPPENPVSVLKAGTGRGPLLGGNLSLVAACIGTPYLPVMRDAVLVLEEVGEVPYRIDRMLMQVVNSGVGRQLQGLLIGQFTKCEPKETTPPSQTSAQVLQEFADQQPGPALGNVQYGHIPKKLTVPLGLTAQIDSRRQRIEVKESAVL